jgi:predicted dehydrogenase
MTRLRWGILGTARIAARRVIPAIMRSQTGTVVAVGSRDAERARQLAAQFGIPRAHGSYEALLADPEVDAVYIPLPNSLHGPWTIRAAEAGKHVLCEKPLALDASSAREMVASCARAGVLLQEAFMYRFHPQIERLQTLVRDGAVGRPWLVRSAFTFTVRTAEDIRLEARLGGGGLLDVGCYCVNLSRLLLGEPERVDAAAVYERGVDVRFAGMLHFPEGAAAQFDCGLRAPPRQSCEVIGPEGVISLPRPFLPEEDPAVLVVRRGGGEERIEIPGANQYTLMIDHFAEYVRTGRPPRFPPDDAVANMRVIDMLRQAARDRGNM